MGYSGFSNGDNIAIPASVVVNDGNPVTVELYYKLPSGAGSCSAFTIGNRLDELCQAHLPVAANIYWDYGSYSGGSNGRVSVAFPGGDYDTWIHVCLVAGDGSGEMAVWVNGAKLVSGPWTPRAADLTGGVIGAWPISTAPPCTGEIAEFAVYTHALADARIAAHAAASTSAGYVAAVLADTPECFYRLNGDATDTSPHGRDGMIVGHPTPVSGPLDPVPTPTISPAGMPSASAFGRPRLLPDQLRPVGIGSASAFGHPTLSGPPRIEPHAIASATAFGRPGLLTFSDVVIDPRSWRERGVFGRPTLSEGEPVVIRPVSF